MKNILLFLILLSCPLESSDFSTRSIPVNYKGRIRPLESYVRLTLHDLYEDKLTDETASDFFLKLYYFGFKSIQAKPLIKIQEREIKIALGLTLERNHFSYTELSIAIQGFKGQSFEKLDLLKQKLAFLESFVGIKKTSPHLSILPNRKKNGEWQPLTQLEKESNNFTAYSQKAFTEIQEGYKEWKQDFQQTSKLSISLLKAYEEIASTPILMRSTLVYPSVMQLKAEVLYNNAPLVSIAIIGCLLAFFCLFASAKLHLFGKIALALAFACITVSLALRCFILMRPPVSNMFETVIYVPWVALLFSFILAKKYRSSLPLAAASILSAILLTLLEFTSLNDTLENVQPVLNSRFWLIIHVLMIVGSYGVLLLAGVFGHLYLIERLKKSSCALEPLAKCLVQTLYLGVALLIPGTILGGVWAAQSWGRFWDWDPKESWAFISSCIYLILIHLYRFKKIESIELSMGAIIGLGFISFTWYGVNYILGTGLHTYGFGSANHSLFSLYLGAEAVFLSIMAFLLKRKLTLEKNA